jgi:hypothetical protein
MTEFAGVQTQTLDVPNPDAPQYIDPQQWWYDMSQAEQDAYRERQVAKIREIGVVVGVHAVTSNAGWITPANPDGINPAVWAEYNRIIREKGYTVKPPEVLRADLAMHQAEVRKIEAALVSHFAGVQG